MLSIENGGSQPALLRDPEDQQTLPRDPEGLADILEASCILEASHVTEVRGGFSSLTHSLVHSSIRSLAQYLIRLTFALQFFHTFLVFVRFPSTFRSVVLFSTSPSRLSP